jgi:Tol biopolymer transport system component
MSHSSRMALLLLVLLIGPILLPGCGRLVPDVQPPPDATLPPDPTVPTGTQRVSISSDGALADGPSIVTAMSANGRYVAFHSSATNLVDGDTNGVDDVFVHDRVLRATVRVSVSSAGAEADGPSRDARLSADGRFVVFTSEATNLAPGDRNEAPDVFVHDREDGTTERASLAPGGGESPLGGRSGRPSADGRYVAFPPAVGGGNEFGLLFDRASGSASPLPDAAFDGVTFEERFLVRLSKGPLEIELVDRVTGTTTMVDIDVGDDYLSVARPTPDGRFLMVESFYDISRFDRTTGLMELVSADPDGHGGNNWSSGGIPSPDGRYVLFASMATNLVTSNPTLWRSLYVRDLDEGITRRAPVTTEAGPETEGSFAATVMSADGRHVAFSYYAAFDDGGRVAGVEGMTPHPANLLEVFAHTFPPFPSPPPPPAPVVELPAGVERVAVDDDGTLADRPSFGTALSHDGRYVAFTSAATNLVPGDTNGTDDVFVRDRVEGTTVRVSVASTGIEGDGASRDGRLSADGRFVAFVSSATTLVPDDTNGVDDIFLHDRLLRTTTRVSVRSDGLQANGPSASPRISLSGGAILFTTDATNLGGGAHYLHERASGLTIALPHGGYDPHVDERFYLTQRTDVYQAWVHDRVMGGAAELVLTRGDVGPDGPTLARRPTPDGRFVLVDSAAPNVLDHATDAPLPTQAFLHDRHSGATALVSARVDGAPATEPSTAARVTPTGTHVLFASRADDLVHDGGGPGGWSLYVRDLGAGQTARLAVSSQSWAHPSEALIDAVLSGDGRHVAVTTRASGGPRAEGRIEGLEPHPGDMDEVFVVTLPRIGPSAARR